MDYMNYPFYPYLPDQAFDNRTFPGGGFGPPGQPPGFGGGFGPPGQPPGFGGGFGPPGQPPGFGGGFGPPGQPPGFGGGFGPPGQPPGGPGEGLQQGGPPSGPPPSFTPQQQSISIQAVDPGAIRGCLYRYTYVWLENGRSFWFYPTFVGRTSVAGWRWRRYRWTYYGTDLKRIRSFQCI